MRCLLCGATRSLEHVNVNVVPNRHEIAEKLGIQWGDHAVAVLCRMCLAEAALTEEA